MSNMRTIRVTGRGQLKVHPDMTRIIITLEGRHKEYGETLQRSSRDTEKIKDWLHDHGYKTGNANTYSYYNESGTATTPEEKPRLYTFQRSDFIAQSESVGEQ